MRTTVPAAAFLLAAFCGPAQAQNQTDAPPLDALGDNRQQPLGPYEALVPAEGQSDAARNTALREALQSVIERRAGFGASSSDAVQSLLDRASQYVIAYGFEVDAGTTAPQTLLRARFDGAAIDEALADAGLISPPQTGHRQLEVAGIETLDDYVRVSAYLRGLPGITQAAPMMGFDDVVRFDVQLRGSEQGLDVLLATDRMLQQLSPGRYPQPARYLLIR